MGKKEKCEKLHKNEEWFLQEKNEITAKKWKTAAEKKFWELLRDKRDN